MDANRHYQSQAVSTASPGQLISMLYAGAIGAVTRAEQALTAAEPGAIEAAHRDLVKAQAIVTELAISLDHDAGGPVAGNLASLYDYCLDRLQQANLAKDPSLLGSVRDVLAGLAETWDEVLRTAAPSPVAVG